MPRHPAGLPPLHGLVLAGGRSRRLGRDKAAIELEGRSLLRRTVARLERLAEPVFVAVRPDQIDDPVRAGFRLLIDAADGLGPAAGLMSAWRHDSNAAWIVLACDLPFIDDASLDALAAARDTTDSVAALRSPVDGGPEPLCAIYEPDALECFVTAVEAGGSPSPRKFLSSAKVNLLSASGDRALANINSMQDFEKYLDHD